MECKKAKKDLEDLPLQVSDRLFHNAAASALPDKPTAPLAPQKHLT